MSMRRLSLVLVLLVLMLSGESELMAGQTATGRTAIEGVNDGSITANIIGKLTIDTILSPTQNYIEIDVQTERGTVILSGMVQTSEQKARAGQLAGQVGGVKGVINNLQVQTAKQP